LKFNYDGSDKNDGLEILLDGNYTPQQTLTIKIDYHTNFINQIDPTNLSGTNGKGLRFSQPTSNDPIKPKEIWSIGEPDLNRYWFPCYDAPNDFRTTEFKATVDKDLMVISNGNLIATQENPDGTHTFHWKTDKPYANHLTNFVVCKYSNFKQNYNGIQLNNYGYPHEQASTQASVERLPDMMMFFSEKIGVKFPYSSYSQAFVQDLPWGMAGNGLVAESENMVDDYGTHADYLYLWDVLEGESLASQWFGNYLTAADWSHVWLNKGFARYFSGLYDSYKNGHDEFLYWLQLADQNTTLFDWNSSFRHPIVTQNYDNALNFTSENFPYSRAALVLNMLKKHLGEEKWWKAINLYVKTNAHKAVETEDFRKAIEQATGEKMDWFFDQWIYKIGHPVFEITKNYDESKKQLTLKVKQNQKTDPKEVYPQVDFFKGKIEIEIDNKIETVWLEVKAEYEFSFNLPQKPNFVNFDYESTWIKEITFEKTLDELLFQLQNSKDILARRDAIIQLSAIAKNEKTTAEDKAKILEALRKTALSNAYWRLRNSALAAIQSLLVPTTETKPIAFDEATTNMLLSLIKNEKSWLKATALSFLGNTKDLKYLDIYVENLKDPSDRVIASAATALAKTKSPKAFEILEKLMEKPSMKSQSRLSALNALKELGDPRGVEVAYKALSDLNLLRWRLPNGSIWDYRVLAVQTIASLRNTEKTYQLLKERFNKSMSENDLEGIFNNTLLIATLGNPHGQEIFEQLKAKYKDDANTMVAVEQYEMQFREIMKK
jgi:aminopeptidase N